jgi:hypothetical protein
VLYYFFNLNLILVSRDDSLCSRERNRMHAKMTRDRKKNFISTIEKTIEELERDCQKMRDVLNKVGAHQQVLTAPVTPLMTPRQDSIPVSREEMPSVIIKAPAPAPVTMPAPFVLAPSPAPVVLASVSSLSPPQPRSPAPSLLLPSLAAAIVSARNPITMTGAENPPKRHKAAHGFSWNG